MIDHWKKATWHGKNKYHCFNHEGLPACGQRLVHEASKSSNGRRIRHPSEPTKSMQCPKCVQALNGERLEPAFTLSGESILEYLKTHPASTVRDISDGLGFTPDQVRNYLQRKYIQPRVKSPRAGPGGVKRYYHALDWDNLNNQPRLRSNPPSGGKRT